MFNRSVVSLISLRQTEGRESIPIDPFFPRGRRGGDQGKKEREREREREGCLQAFSRVSVAKEPV